MALTSGGGAISGLDFVLIGVVFMLVMVCVLSGLLFLKSCGWWKIEFSV